MKKTKLEGFTIIEVVLVLAIAGLIFLMVFIALPALQRSQRNTRRREDMARIMSAVADYQGNNGGRLPLISMVISSGGSDYNAAALDEDFPIRYIEEELKSGPRSTGSGKVGRKIYIYECQAGKSCNQFRDPDGSLYKIAASGPDLGHADQYTHDFDHVVYITSGVICSDTDEQKVESTGNPNDSAVRYVLEGGSIYCNDNN